MSSSGKSDSELFDFQLVFELRSLDFLIILKCSDVVFVSAHILVVVLAFVFDPFSGMLIVL